MTARLDVDAIAARAEAAPGGQWEAFTDSLRIPWSVPYDPDDVAHTDDADPGAYPWLSGRWLAVREGHWHTGSPDPGPELWEFLAAARGDVLELVAEIRRLRAVQRGAAPHPGPAAGRRRSLAATLDATVRRHAPRGRRAVRPAADIVADHSRPWTGTAMGEGGGGTAAGAKTGRTA
jgi:hypothetical protein